MENIFELSFAGTPKGLMDYIKKNSPLCDICNDEGFYERIEWVGEDTSYPVTIRCECQND